LSFATEIAAVKKKAIALNAIKAATLSLFIACLL